MPLAFSRSAMLGADRSPSLVGAPANAFPLTGWLKPVGLAVGSFLLLTAAWYAAQLLVLDHTASAAITASVANARSPLRPDDTIQISVQGAGVQLAGAQLFRADQGDDGSRTAEQAIPVRLNAVGDGAATSWQVVAASGEPLLRPDGAYRLSVRVAAPRPAIPLPRTDLVDQQYRFSTLASPRLQVPSGVMQPRWAEPVSVSWSAPMQTVAATVEPAAPFKTWIDAADPRKTWVQLGDETGTGIVDGQTYEVRVAEARARDGIALQRPISFKLAMPARPRFVDPPQAPVTLRYGDSFTLKSSTDMTNVQVTTSDAAAAQVVVGRDAINLTMPSYRQGATFDVSVLSATSLEGAPLAQPLTIRFTTPPALPAPEVSPEDESYGVQPATYPAITFPEAVANQAEATAALQIEPAIDGRWEWTSPTRVEFVPDVRLPIFTDVTVGVQSGPEGPRTAAGGFLEHDLSATFRTTDYKRVDVSLSRQIMTLFENDVPVRTIYVATGVAKAPTPTGTYYVQYKAPEMRFRGVNADGTRYDIEDVHWVMPFWGDYTIHGAYWRGRFGAPGSNGCVSMSDADAKLVYDWANVGTPIVIHT